IINCWDENVIIEFGKSTKAMGRYSYLSLKTATDDLVANKIHGLVTCPIDKNNIQSSSFNFPGHTEFLASRCGVSEPLMLMISDDLKVAVVTGHIPIKDIAGKITSDLILKKINLLSESLNKDFGNSTPKIAVLGLNPHAGDKGTLGEEEITTIIPAINSAKEDGLEVSGPFSADGFFGSQQYKECDAILAMYHDQGLIPFKAFTYNTGVNFTAALPIVRTSPDHGTALEIAGKNSASELSFHCAIVKAVEVVKARRLFKSIRAETTVAES
ncbi:MAG: 4-hydroxythreonine-4-phosphate dehydrogenase PdxA, partial [Bacteroidetes bacterium]|nr:4-hydroxythreonine-4-phosphate dehydrogenase PdxA [Bacteroidota bacterium]